MTRITDVLVRAVDLPLGWMLTLPRDVALLLFAIGTALLMTLVRRAVTNQDLLRRCSNDLKRLKQLLKEARKSHDKATVGRVRATIGKIKGMQLAADMRVLAVVLIPVGILAVWATERFDYLPPRVGDHLVLRATYSVSSINQVTHLVPLPQLELKSPIQIVRTNPLSPQGIAEWTIHPTEAGEYLVTFRHLGESVTHRLAIGRTTYRPPVQSHHNDRLKTTEVILQQYLPLGSSLGSKWVGLPPWMIGYLVLTLILVPTLKRILNVS